MLSSVTLIIQTVMDFISYHKRFLVMKTVLLGFICFTPHSGAQNYGDEFHIQSIDRLGKLISSRSLQKQCLSLSGYSKDLTVDCFHKD